MLKFPNHIVLKLIEGLTHKPITIPNVIISIHIFAIKKNDYNLGPFFSDKNGEIKIDKHVLDILAEAEIQTGLMDYNNIHECSPLVEINILSEDEINNLITGRKLWGISEQEKEIYTTKEELLKKISYNNNKCVQPDFLRALWDKHVSPDVVYELLTNLR